MKTLIKKLKKQPRGQSFIELTGVFIVLMIIFTGVVELGFFLNVYLDVIDAGREAARNANTYDLYKIESDGSKSLSNLVFDEAAKIAWNTMNPGCQGLLDDKLVQLMPPPCEMRIPFDPTNGYDDIVVTVISYDGSIVRLPGPAVSPPGGPGYWNRFDNQTTRIDEADLNSLGLDPTALATGMIMVEIYYQHYQMLGLPILSTFVPNPIRMHTYSIMPYPSADPTPTPIP
jgi:hypothetical protein